MKLTFSRLSLFCSILACFVLFSCTKKKDEAQEPEPNVPSANREEMLRHIADKIIVPSYANFDTKLDVMVNKSNAFTAAPSQTTLDELRLAWEEAYIEWQKVELFDVGPAYNHVLRSYVNIYPATVQGIHDNIANGASANLDVPASYPTQGFPAFDYLINGIAGTDLAILDLYTTDADASKRIAYVQRLTNQINTKFNQVYSEWTSGYQNTFPRKSGIDMQSSLSLLVNGYVLNYERYIRSGKFGIPSGAMVGGVVSPDKIESYYKKDLSLTLAKTAHQASIDFFNGKSVLNGKKGFGFKVYLDAIGAVDTKTGQSLTNVLNNQFESANDRMDLLGPNLYNEINTNNQKVIDVYAEMQKAVRLLKVDMTSAMSITITYTDNDGD